MLSLFSRVWFFATSWTVAHQAPLSMGFSRQEYWSGLPCRLPGHLEDLTQGLKPCLLCLTCIDKWVLYNWYHLGSPQAQSRGSQISSGIGITEGNYKMIFLLPGHRGSDSVALGGPINLPFFFFNSYSRWFWVKCEEHWPGGKRWIVRKTLLFLARFSTGAVNK